MNKTQGYFIAIAIVITLIYLFYGPSATMTHNPTTPNIDFIPDIGKSSPPPAESSAGDPQLKDQDKEKTEKLKGSPAKK